MGALICEHGNKADNCSECIDKFVTQIRRETFIEAINIINQYPEHLTKEDFDYIFDNMVMAKEPDHLLPRKWILWRLGKKLKEYEEKD